MVTEPRSGDRQAVVLVLVEQSESDAELILDALRDAGKPAILKRVESKPALAAAMKELEPDVVLSEYALSLMNFRDVLTIVQETRPHTPVIVVTDRLRTEDAGSCVRAGAETVIGKSNLRGLAKAIDEAIEAREPLRRLTPRQIQVMRLATQGYRTREIARTLGLSEKTVEHHRHQLMRRLGLDSYADLVRYAVRVGVTLAASTTSIAFMLTHGEDSPIPRDRAV